MILFQHLSVSVKFYCLLLSGVTNAHGNTRGSKFSLINLDASLNHTIQEHHTVVAHSNSIAYNFHKSKHIIVKIFF